MSGQASVVAVSAKARHGVNKANRAIIRLLAGEGVVLAAGAVRAGDTTGSNCRPPRTRL